MRHCFLKMHLWFDAMSVGKAHPELHYFFMQATKCTQNRFLGCVIAENTCSNVLFLYNRLSIICCVQLKNIQSWLRKL